VMPAATSWAPVENDAEAGESAGLFMIFIRARA
jgi:hypothetical protein